MTLSNKYVFWSIWLFFVTILTGINNYYFYEFVEDTAFKNAAQLENTILSQTSCLNDYKQSSLCKDKIIDLIKANIDKKFSFYNHSLTLSEENGTILWQHLYPKKAVAGSDIKINFTSSEKHIIISYTTFFDTPEFMMSVFRSMTFSISDLLPIVYNEGIKSAVESFKKRKMFHRTRPTIGFALFSFLILWLYKRRELQIEIEQQNKEQKIIKEFKEEIFKMNNNTNEHDLYAKFIQYDDILNPPMNTINFKDLISLDTNGIGNKFRKVLEKLFFPIVSNKLNTSPRDLKDAIYLLYDNKLISSKTQIYATLIRLYGNMDSHYNENTEITKEEINVLAFRLISIIEEIVERNLLLSSEEKKQTLQKSKKVFDKEQQKFIEISA